MSEEKKIYYPGMFDFIKGIALIDIIAGHSMGYMTGLDSSWLYSKWNFLVVRLFYILGDATIPLLFMIMGYGYRPMPEKRCLKKQAKSLLIPYMWTGFFVVLIYPICRFFLYRDFKVCVIETTRVAISHILGLTRDAYYFGHHFVFIGAVWFLVVSFECWILLNFLSNRFHGKSLTVCICACMLIGCTIGPKLAIPYGIAQSFVCIGYFYIGWLFKKYDVFSKKFPHWMWALVIFAAFINFAFGHVSIAYADWKLGILDLLSVGCQAYLLMWAALRINHFNFPFMHPVRLVGRYSLWVMCCHTVESQALGPFWCRLATKLIRFPITGAFLIFLMKSLFTFIGCLIISKHSKFVSRKRRMKRSIRGVRNV